MDNGTEAVNAKNVAISLFLFFFLAYLLTASGYTSEDVSQLRMEAAKSFVERFDFSVPPEIGLAGADGRSYSWFGIGPVLMVVPFHIIGKICGLPPGNFVFLLNQIISAATAVLVFRFSTCLGYSRRASLLTSIFYGLGTMAWYYAKDPGDHALETFLTLLTVYFGHRYSKEKEISCLQLSALFLGLALLTRPTSVLVMPPLMILMFFNGLHTGGIRKTARLNVNAFTIFILLLLPFVCLDLWYNYYRFGSIFETGHALMAARLKVDYFAGTKLLTGLRGFLLSPGKGFFYYSPIAILFFFSVKSFGRKHPKTALCFILIIMSYLIFYSKNIFWHGGSGWGPRYIFVITPFLIIPVVALLDSTIYEGKTFKGFFVFLLFIVSFIVQLAAVSVNPNKYLTHMLIDEKVKYTFAEGHDVQSIIGLPSNVIFDWSKSPVIAQFEYLYEISSDLRKYKYTAGVTGSSPVDSIKQEPWMNVFDFWWFYKYAVQKSYTGFYVALALFLFVFIYAIRLWKTVFPMTKPVK